MILQQNFDDEVWAALQQTLPIQFEDDSPIPVFKSMGKTMCCIFYLATVFAVELLRELLREMTELSSVQDRDFARTFPSFK